MKHTEHLRPYLTHGQHSLYVHYYYYSIVIITTVTRCACAVCQACCSALCRYIFPCPHSSSVKSYHPRFPGKHLRRSSGFGPNWLHPEARWLRPHSLKHRPAASPVIMEAFAGGVVELAFMGSSSSSQHSWGPPRHPVWWVRTASDRCRRK